MESQPGARSALVDPFGRELEEWLRDAPATRNPYVSDLVVPPVTGPVVRPVVPDDAPRGDTDGVPTRSFRRERGRHASVCAPSFPEPPERFALRFEQLAVEVSASSGRTVIERIVFLESEVRRRESDLLRLATWETEIADSADPEARAARDYARAAFADIIADAAAETALLERRTARRVRRRERDASAQAERDELLRLIAATRSGTDGRPAAADGGPAGSDGRTDGADLRLQAEDEADDGADEVTSSGFSPVAATTRPTPLVQPLAGPDAHDRDAVDAAVRAHTGEQPIVLVADRPAAPAAGVDADSDAGSAAIRRSDADGDGTTGADETARPGWWTRVVAALLRMLGRR